MSGATPLPGIASLIDRQRQIMELVVAGHANKEIAARLGINQRSVESHRALIMKKTGQSRWSISFAGRLLDHKLDGAYLEAIQRGCAALFGVSEGRNGLRFLPPPAR